MFLLPRRQVLFSALSAPLLVRAAAPPLRVIYPRPMREIDPSTWYPLQLLKLALAASGVACDLQPSRLVTVQSRALMELQHQRDSIDIVWTMSSAQREQDLLPIRIPIFKGLYGWRLFLVRRGQEQAMREVRSLADLAEFVMVQGHDWPDTEIMRANGLQVVTGSSFDALFSMLRLNRGQAFPRSVLEIDWEQRSHTDSFVVEPHLALHYPAAIYFFVRRGNQRLAHLVEQGLQRMIAKGSFEQLFQQYHRSILAGHALGSRRVIELHNPLLTPETPLQNKALWLQP
ncbi:transporter substrate-binding domain-containing protein [Paucibacter sp. DJ1R-11]|uniref:substrate-binding periplasmic protein n=1 Tax=Paucibacter sp. DJ1R-11 TaxID=2893556 RepID=UPI0021E36B9A|nr:transporter substrate-binding domain-containing protein [Paucibacter sp. DJ1R-11]MCV2365697.1 transporter substrate-binding domain-containing protein [Paucibacter sp. DJ1R-11]